MSNKQFFINAIKSEVPAFERVLVALPESKLDYRPHPKSRSALEVANVMAGGPMGMAMVLGKGIIGDSGDPEMNMPMQKSKDKLLKFYQDGIRMLENEIKSMSESEWDEPAVMMMNGKEMWKSKKGEMVWGFLLDGIHHRGQLSAYIRPMGGKVPSIYGPSGDDAGAMM